MQFDVVDTGVGMAPEQLARIFQPFTQADESVTRQFGGTGLGLTICSSLAELLGGELTVESQPGKGSTFRLTIVTGSLEAIPFVENVSTETQPGVPTASSQDQNGQNPAASNDRPRQSSVQKPSARVLLAEDGRDNQKLISFVLRKAGVAVEVAENGQDAVNAVLDRQTTEEAFDVVLMDMQMPVMDGYSATRHLRNAGVSCPIIALTANAMSDDRDKCLDSGCDDYTTKPIDRQQLTSLIAQYSQPAELPV